MKINYYRNHAIISENVKNLVLLFFILLFTIYISSMLFENYIPSKNIKNYFSNSEKMCSRLMNNFKYKFMNNKIKGDDAKEAFNKLKVCFANRLISDTVKFNSKNSLAKNIILSEFSYIEPIKKSNKKINNVKKNK